MNILSIFSASCCYKPIWIYLFCWTQKKVFWRMLVATDFHSMKTKTLWKSMATSNCLVSSILQNIIFCLEQHEGECMILGELSPVNFYIRTTLTLSHSLSVELYFFCFNMSAISHMWDCHTHLMSSKSRQKRFLEDLFFHLKYRLPPHHNACCIRVICKGSLSLDSLSKSRKKMVLHSHGKYQEIVF